ncbi:MAG: HD domain-containing protein, partial [Betaproteobacteria bacterium]|nr:HD domain-containing protein [Betaproteobacteria bacterium]
IARLYRGDHPAFHPCDTGYHDIQHVLDVALAMARLMDGYERSRYNGTPPLPPEIFTLGIIAALFHDVGYLRRRNDRTHRYGAEYTLSHVSRGVTVLRRYLERLGMHRVSSVAAPLLHFTGYERAAKTIRLSDRLLRRLGEMLGTADILAQMSDRCYLEKCRDRLYPEFVLGGLTTKKLADGREQTVYASGDELVRCTPAFYRGALERLENTLGRAYQYAEYHFDRQNVYFEEMQKNIRFAESMVRDSTRETLRRLPPWTLVPGVTPYPESLAGC